MKIEDIKVGEKYLSAEPKDHSDGPGWVGEMGKGPLVCTRIGEAYALMGDGYSYDPEWLTPYRACSGPIEIETILQEATRIVDGPRRADYGHPRDNHLCTARMWSAYLERRFRLEPGALALNQRDVCQLNVLQKVSRDANAPKRDNLVDQCGWSRNAEMVEE